MADLIAQGEKSEDHWRRPLPQDETVVLGRGGDTWAVPWDRWVSRRHAELSWHDNLLRVRQLPTGRNPVYFRGMEVPEFELRPGEGFAIGDTVFTLGVPAETPSADRNPLLQSRSASPQELERIPFRDAPHRIDVLSRLPGVISSAADDNELLIQLINLLLAGIPRADVIAVVATEPGGGTDPPVRVLHWDQRALSEATFQPSRRLVREAVCGARRTVLHVWAAGGEPAGRTFTLQGNFDWAFCTPVRGDWCRGWGIYVAGRFTGDAGASLLVPWESNDLRDDLKFTELVAAILSALRLVRKLQRDQALLSRFFSPAVQRVLTAAEPEKALQPRETEVTVLFCDLRGFSRKVEAAADDLLAVLDRVSRALGVMTEHILAHKGVIADFLGDAAMGFWGWPLTEPDMVQQACLAALGIRTYYEALARSRDHPLAEFRVGIGVATGRAVAGRIGTLDQAKVTVFGPVVNLASRLEGMTKILHVPILIDEATAGAVRERLPRQVARCRRLALVKPYGLETPLMVSELLPPAGGDEALGDEHVAAYEAALDAFLKRDWSAAYEHLHRVPPQDLGKDILTGFIIQHNHTPPAGWDGVIPLASKT
jgi:adenylate cyclase